jgi:hypothetical protein
MGFEFAESTFRISQQRRLAEVDCIDLKKSERGPKPFDFGLATFLILTQYSQQAKDFRQLVPSTRWSLIVMPPNAFR